MSATTSPAVSDSPPPAEQGRRERKKLQTRQALIDAALELFERQGFDATTVEQITDAVDLSRRTFNRYFTTKEDVVMAVELSTRTLLLDSLRRQPPQTPPAAALRDAYLMFLDGFRKESREDELSRFLKHNDVVQSSPALSARSYELAYLKEQQQAAVIGERMGLDPDSDPRPRFIVASWGVALRIAFADLLRERGIPDLATWEKAVRTAYELMETDLS